MIHPEFEFYRSLGVPARTIYEWKQSRQPNRYARLLWQWFSAGVPTSENADWCGWRFFENELWSPEGSTFRPGDLRMLDFYRRNGLASGNCDAVRADYDAVTVNQHCLWPQYGEAATRGWEAASQRYGHVNDDAISI